MPVFSFYQLQFVITELLNWKGVVTFMTVTILSFILILLFETAEDRTDKLYCISEDMFWA